jgi:cation:H+ antiporter
MLLLLLAVALAGTVIGEPLSVAGIGLTPVLLLAGYVLTIRLSQPGDRRPPWRATNLPDTGGDRLGEPRRDLSNASLYGLSAAASFVILAAGWALASTGDAFAEQTGLGSSFVGVALIAASTSLPELSTTLAAARLGNHEMAVSNILGTNCLTVALFALGDVAYREGPILAATDRSAQFAATIGMAVTALYLIGLLERRNRTLLRMGYDSFGVLVTYAAGLVGLYTLR